MDLDNFLGVTKKEIRNSWLIQGAMKESDGFTKWFNDKFIKYEGAADWKDVEVLSESLENIPLVK